MCGGVGAGEVDCSGEEGDGAGAGGDLFGLLSDGGGFGGAGDLWAVELDDIAFFGLRSGFSAWACVEIDCADDAYCGRDDPIGSSFDAADFLSGVGFRVTFGRGLGLIAAS